MSDRTTEELFAELSVEWGDVYVCRRAEPMHDDTLDRYCVRDHTDEGLGGERRQAYGRTLRDALENALAGDMDDPWSDPP